MFYHRLKLELQSGGQAHAELSGVNHYLLPLRSERRLVPLNELGANRRGFMGGIAAGSIGLGLNQPPFWAESEDTVEVPVTESVSDMFLDIDGIEGTSRRRGHQDEIEIRAWQFGMERPMDDRTRRGSSGPKFDSLFIGKNVDKASPQLMTSFANGRHHKTATIAVQSEDNSPPVDWLTIELKDVEITDITNFATHLFFPVEEFSMTFGEISVTVVEFDDTGSVETEWDFNWKIE